VADFLAHMAGLSRARAHEARARLPERELRTQIADRESARLLAPTPFLLIAEIKRASPTAGVIESGPLGLKQRADAYTLGGAGVISVLTEPSRFQGSLEDLAEVSRHITTPVMRKDFLVDPYQVLEGRVCGASGVLLIVKMLSDAALVEMAALAYELGMFALIECFDREDLDRCRSLQPGPNGGLLIGLNTRDLRDLSVDGGRLERLADAFPLRCRRIAESGMETPAEIRLATEHGYDGALVGSALMRAADPAFLCRAMIAEASRALAPRGTRDEP
jgi:indole-3-glycerol phosphate synthase